MREEEQNIDELHKDDCETPNSHSNELLNVYINKTSKSCFLGS